VLLRPKFTLFLFEGHTEIKNLLRAEIIGCGHRNLAKHTNEMLLTKSNKFDLKSSIYILAGSKHWTVQWIC